MRLMPRWLRVFLVLNIVQDLVIALSGLALGGRIVLPLQHVTPLNARFIASLYLAGGVGVGVSALIRYAVDARVVLAAFLVITTLVELMTFVAWDDFSAGGVPAVWIFTYTVDPIVAAAAFVALGLWRPALPGWHRLTPLFVCQLVLFGAFGVALLAAPGSVAEIWPWGLPALLGRVYGSFFCAFAVGAALAAWERRGEALRPFVLSTLAFLIASAVSSAIHHAKFSDSPETWTWVAVHAVGIAAFGAALVALRAPQARGPALAPAAR
jgi:hypothetical protein